MHNAALAALGLNWRYLAFEVHPSHLQEALAGAKRMHFIGVNLTVPHKLMAVNWVDALDDSARLLGAVNTIRFEGLDRKGEWQPLRVFTDELPTEVRSHGFNTDADAVVSALQEDLMLECAGAKVLVIGVGGAGQATALKLAAEKVAALYLVNRTASKAASLAARLRSAFPKVKTHVGYPAEAVDLVINATSLGLSAHDELPFDPRQFSLEKARAAYDMIYRPATTPFVRVAQAAGCRTANGLSMLLHQGAKALEIWTGSAAPIKIMHEALEKDVYGGANDGR
jgi:shikimate dehydrogenase